MFSKVSADLPVAFVLPLRKTTLNVSSLHITHRSTYLCPLLPPSALQVHRIYRGTGGSFQKAQTEWNNGTWRDPLSREAQFNNFSGNSLPEYPTVPTYPASGSQWP